MDSSVLLFMAADRGYKEIHTVTFDYGQRHSKELQCVTLQKWNLQEKFPGVKFTNKCVVASVIRLPIQIARCIT
jgi:7-cyano-7-deazaguanine synthase in queuosine biosynthesis